ncbi:MAG TPA: ankyrin repeat domain-containing protein [Chloroflexota bacterium]
MTAIHPSEEQIKDVVLNAHGNLDRVKELVEANPDLVTVVAPWNETPLQAASHMGHCGIAEFLLSNGAQLDIFAAAMLGRQSDVAAFLDGDPDLVRSRGVHDMPILYFPATRGELAVAELLVERGADANDGAGQNTALHATAHFGQPAMARWLLERGADATAVDFENKTPLQIATEREQLEVARLLQDYITAR